MPALDNVPTVTVYEAAVIKCAGQCETYRDMVAWCAENGITDTIHFIDLALFTKGELNA